MHWNRVKSALCFQSLNLCFQSIHLCFQSLNLCFLAVNLFCSLQLPGKVGLVNNLESWFISPVIDLNPARDAPVAARIQCTFMQPVFEIRPWKDLVTSGASRTVVIAV